ncbi:MAG TPA: hypothetical protein VGC34_04255 [Steroidobacteraceae bacterium]
MDEDDEPFDPTPKAFDLVDGLIKPALNMQLLRCAGIEQMPMLRETRDPMGRIGYAYEGEPLLLWVELHRGSWRLTLHPRVAALYEIERRYPINADDKEEALRLAFEMARVIPAGFVAQE